MSNRLKSPTLQLAEGAKISLYCKETGEYVGTFIFWFHYGVRPDGSEYPSKLINNLEQAKYIVKFACDNYQMRPVVDRYTGDIGELFCSVSGNLLNILNYNKSKCVIEQWTFEVCSKSLDRFTNVSDFEIIIHPSNIGRFEVVNVEGGLNNNFQIGTVNV